ncbi:hypothetical protein [Jannaschia marina]|uniref:hypothetical protein n=1 Tax=Jannaschia marina TaxID=2741674 RepID=UPI0015C8FED9|nr:hypothetical protein [Jannaschia marina]
MKVWQIVLLALAGIGLLAGGGVWGVLHLTADGRALARGFVIDFLSDPEAARAAMVPGLAADWPLERLRAEADRLEPFETTSFTSYSAEMGVGTTVKGTATTASGCKSPVTVEMFEGEVIAFEFKIACLRSDVGA